MSIKVQRVGTLLLTRKTSAPRQQARRERLRRSPEETDSKPRPAESLKFRSFAPVGICGSAGTGSDDDARFACSQSFSTRREVCGTCEKRIPTRPDESCHMTSPDNRISEVLCGGENWK